MRSLRYNLGATYLSQVYVTLLGILVVPTYLRVLGVEAYGLIGFFTLLQAWFNLLDAGLTPTVARESARYHGKALEGPAYRQLLLALEQVFVAVAVAGASLLLLLAGPIAADWLQATTLDLAEVRLSIQIMAVIIALRWMTGLYRGVITGAEHMTWLGGFASVVASIRFLGVLPVLAVAGATPRVFFLHQLLVAIAELATLAWYARRLLPAVPALPGSPWRSPTVRTALRFSMSIAFTSATWILVTQTDKLVLSKILSLSAYGQYSLAVLVASGVLIVTGPVSAAVLPRLARLEAERDHAGVIRLYRGATQLVAVVAGATSATLAIWSEPLLLAWTGDAALATAAAPVLSLYAIGNGILAVSAFPYYLQYAKGDVRMHVIGSAGFVLLLVPASIWGAMRAGGIGAGIAWAGLNALSFTCWLPWIHARIAPGLNGRWYGVDVLSIFAATAAAGALVTLVASRQAVLGLVQLGGIGALLLTAALAASSETRRLLRQRWGVAR